MHKLLSERGGLVVLGVPVFYLLLAPAHVVDGDNARLATSRAVGGTFEVARQTGPRP